MKLVWHIIKKDIARDRWALVIWSLLFVGQVVIGVVARQGDRADQDWVVYAQLGNAGLIGLQIVMGYIMVARLVQADALIGTTMFWPTRPISAARLLVAKALGALLLFGLIPVLMLLPWWLYCNFGWHEILWTAVETLGWQLLVIAPAFLVGSLTDDLGRVLLWTLLLVIALLSWMVLLVASFSGTSGNAYSHAGPAVMFTKLWLSAVVLVVGATAIAAHQYLTRHFVRSVVLVAFCLGLIALIGQVWPWNWTKAIGELHQPALAPTAAGLVEGLTFEVVPAQGYFGRNDKGKRDGIAEDASLDLRLRVHGLPKDMTIAAENVKQTWSWANGLKLTRDGTYYPRYDPQSVVLRRTYSLPVLPEDPETAKWEKARREKMNAIWSAQGIRPYNPDIPSIGSDTVLMSGYTTLPNSFLAKMRVESPAYAANMECTIFRPEVVVDLPLKNEARASGQSQTFHLLRLNDENPLMVSTQSSVARHGLWYPAVVSSEIRMMLAGERIMAVNHLTGDINWVGDHQMGSYLLQVGGVIVDWNIFFIRPREVIRDGKWVVSDPQWRDHTTLVFLTEMEVARFTREVKTDKFELEPDRPDKSSEGQPSSTGRP